MKSIRLAAACLIGVWAAEGAATEIGGRLEVGLRAWTLADTTWLQDATYSRIEIEEDLGKGATVEIALEGLTYHGKTDFHIFDALPDAVVEEFVFDVLGGSDTSFSGVVLPFLGSPGLFQRQPLFDEVRIDRATLQFRLGGTRIVAGRQPMAWGSGYAWNPTDIFARKSLLDPTREGRGQDLLRFQWGVGVSGTIDLVAIIDDTLEESGAAIRLAGRWLGLDLAFVAADRRWRRTAWSELFSSTDPPPLEWNAQPPYLTIVNDEARRSVIGADLRGEWGGTGFWVEAGWNALGFWDTTIGLERVLDTQTYCLLELHQEGQGDRSALDYDFDDWMKTLTGERGGLGRYYGMAVINHPVTELTEVSLLSLANLSDGSTLLQVRLERSLLDDLVLEVSSECTWADEGDELGQIGPGGQVRVTGYF